MGDLFSDWGAAIVDADDLAREVVAPGTTGLAEIVKSFGPEVLRPDGALDRKRLGTIVFSDPLQRRALEAVVHPLVRAAWLARLDALKTGTASLIVYVVPLLFESKFVFPEIEQIVLVTAPEAARIARITARDSISEDQARARIAAQLPDDEKRRGSHFVIENDGSLEHLEHRAKKVFDALCEEE